MRKFSDRLTYCTLLRGSPVKTKYSVPVVIGEQERGNGRGGHAQCLRKWRALENPKTFKLIMSSLRWVTCQHMVTVWAPPHLLDYLIY